MIGGSNEIDGDPYGFPVASLTGETVARIAPDANLFEIADALTAGTVGVLVVGAGDDVDGIVSERDLVQALADRCDLGGTRAVDIAHRELVWCDATATIGAVATEMMEHYIRHVLVEDDGRLVGIVSARDLLGAYAALEPVLLPEE